jgi:hypothetical protein
MKNLDELFNELEAENAAKPAPQPTPLAEIERKQAEFQRLLDEAGPEVDEDEDDADEEGEAE